MLSNCSEMLTLGTYWQTWYSMVSDQTCTIDHTMDQNLWQMIISFDLLHSSYMWFLTILSCRKHCQTMQIGTVSRLRFCKRSWGFKIYSRWSIVHFGKSYICSNKLDVQETNFSFTQFNRIRNHFFGCRIEVGWYTALDLWDLIVAVLHGNTYQSNQERRDPCTNLREVRAAPDKAWWLHSPSESTLINLLETPSRSSILDIIIQSTGSRTAIMAKEVIWTLCQVIAFTKRRSSIIREARNSKASTQGHAEEQLACAAATALSQGRRKRQLERGCYLGKWSRNAGRTERRHRSDKGLWKKWANSSQWTKKSLQMHSWKSKRILKSKECKLVRTTFVLAKTWPKKRGCSVKNQAVLSSRWAMNAKLIELKKSSSIQCPSCLHYVFWGYVYLYVWKSETTRQKIDEPNQGSLRSP